jgi:catechol 2,3-dioxygenase-like lactoylglutathione lyase family enzyme
LGSSRSTGACNRFPSEPLLAVELRKFAQLAENEEHKRSRHVNARKRDVARSYRMVRTFGLTHIALAVRDVERSSRFYQNVFGAVEVYRRTGFAQLQTPGARDVLVLEEAADRAGQTGGVAHFGFRLMSPADIDLARAAVESAGGTVREQGEFVPREPYLFAVDPDGYELEIWYELPTRIDPPASFAY